jgi:hypothetical protein
MAHLRIRSRIRAVLTGAAIVPILVTGIATSPLSVSANTTRLISSSGTARITGGSGSTSTAGVQNPELPGSAGGDAAAAVNKNGANRSHTSTHGGYAGIAVGDGNGTLAGSNPELVTSFEGLNHFTNRFGVSNGNQFSLEPPDQGLCAGNGFVMETINDVLAVYTPTGAVASGPQALNAFYGYKYAINRDTTDPNFGERGPFVTDPSCLFDAATQRWFHVALTLEVIATGPTRGQFTGANHLDLAVSKTSDPRADWNLYTIPVQDDGTAGTPDHHCSGTWYDGNPNNACLGDYPHIGADANGFYITTNEYSFFGNTFHGAQIYAFSKQALANGDTAPVTQIDTTGMDNGNSGFTLAPAQAPPGGAQESGARGTEYFLSSNAADEAHGNGAAVGPRSSSQILVWALTNTDALKTSSTPTLTLRHTTLGVNTYAFPSPSNQKSGPTPLRDCFNNKPCSKALIGIADPFQEKEYNLDSSDTRMLQTTFAAGKLWGALDTSLPHAGSKSAGIEWFVVNPSVANNGSVSASGTNGFLGLPDDNLIYPAIGVTAAGRGVMAFTVVGGNRFPSAGYALITSSGVGTVHVAKEGLGPADGFSGYVIENYPDPIRPRWGDYGAAAVVGNQVWLASEYIGQTCTLAQFEASNFRCGNTRTALANWDTRISLVTP